MVTNNLLAIKQLQQAFKFNKKYKKAWKDYIELCIIEAMEENKSPIKSKDQLDIAKKSSEKILRMLFDADWWEAQSVK